MNNSFFMLMIGDPPVIMLETVDVILLSTKKNHFLVNSRVEPMQIGLVVTFSGEVS
jgi:hypothetical protein